MKLSINALRALNEYRRDSPLTYLALRYTLNAACAREARWAEEIAPELTSRKATASYLKQQQFKEKHRGKIEYRRMHFPDANEALAEASLLAACEKAGGAFKARRGVYSYHLAKPESLDGFFRPFMELFRLRQAAIAKRCKAHPNHTVVYADIKKFYPSVSNRRSLTAWRRAYAESPIEGKWAQLGENLIKKQSQMKEKGLLVGPRFSHLIADLILRDVDKEIRELCGGGYYRYVDDFAIVVSKNKVPMIKSHLRKQLRKVGLKLHPGKFYTMQAAEWRKNAFTQDELGLKTEGGEKWMSFIDRLKGFLVTRPLKNQELREGLELSGFRIPLPRYKNQVSENQYVGRFSNRLKKPWFLRRTSRASISGLIHSAIQLKTYYLADFQKVIGEYKNLEGIQKKWALSRLRFLLGKLLMLVPEDQVKSIREETEKHPSLITQTELLRAIELRDLSHIVTLGPPACAVIGELLAGSEIQYKVTPQRWSPAAIDGYNVLVLKGVRLRTAPPPHVRQRRIVRLVAGKGTPLEWVHLDDYFMRELAALCGGATLENHRNLMAAPLDPGEPLSINLELINLDGIFS